MKQNNTSMISAKSLADSIIPNIYIKNAMIDSVYSSTEKVTNYKNVGYYNPEDSKSIETAALSDHSQTTIMLSIKFFKNHKTTSHLMQLFNEELAGAIKYYVHQITEEASYKQFIITNDAGFLARDFTENPPANITGVKTKTFLLQDSIKAPEQILDDGTRVIENTKEEKFLFPNETKFLAYVLVPVIQHKELGETILGKVTADILILNNSLQNEGLVFTIAQFSNQADVKELSKFGKPGQVWAGSVHLHEESGYFMAGAKHDVFKVHPRLDYQIVPVTKFVDNRIKEKVDRNIINVSKMYEKINSHTVRYKSNAVNLLDFKARKPNSFISNIMLSQGEGSINGFFSIDKLNLIQDHCAFPFLFENIIAMNIDGYMSAKDNEAAQQTVLFTTLLSNSTGVINIYQNDTLLKPGAFDNTSLKIDLAATNIKMNGNQMLAGINHYYFKVKNLSVGTYKYKVEVSYTDPTINFVNDILNDLIPAQGDINTLLRYLEMTKVNTSGRWQSSFNSITKKINNPKQVINDQAAVGNAGVSIALTGAIKKVESFFNDLKTRIFLYSPELQYSDLRTYISNLSNLYTATADTLLILANFLATLRTQLEKTLDGYGAKKTKSVTPSSSTYVKSEAFSNIDRKNITIKALQENIINITDSGYDFTGFIKSENGFFGRNTNSYPVIDKTDYKKACENAMFELLNTEAKEEKNLDVLNENISPKGLPTTKVSDSAYSYMTIPTTLVKSCVVLPPTVVDISATNVNIENIFTSIIKNNNSLLETATGANTKLSHKSAVRKDLEIIISNLYNTKMHNIVFSSTFSSLSSIIQALPSANTQEEETIVGSDEELTLPPNMGALVSGIDARLKNSNNFLLASILSKLLLSNTPTLSPPMSAKGFLPYSSNISGIAGLLSSHGIAAGTSDDTTLRLPLQVTALSPASADKGSFFDFENGNSTYINKNVINPLLLCYYWFKHQNIVKIEFLDKFEDTTDTSTSIAGHSTNLYQQQMDSNIVKTRNVKMLKWKIIDYIKIESLEKGENLLCRMTQYKYPYYINNKLSKVLNLPLINNYFILRG